MRILSSILIGLAGIFVPLFAFAQESIAEYIGTFYKFSLGIAGALAMAMIVVGSLYYSLSGVADKKNEGKEFITSAIYGLILLLGAYLILNTINPELTQLRDVGCYEEPCNLATSSFAFQDPRVTNNCGDFGVIQEPNSSITCSASEQLYQGPNFTIGDDGRYYNEWGAEAITAGTKIWVYPFFNSDFGTSSKRCLVYAYQKPGGSWTRIDTDSGIQRCSGTFPEQSTIVASPQPAPVSGAPAACNSPATIYSPGYAHTLNCAVEQQISPGTTLSFSQGAWYTQDVTIRPNSNIWVKPYFKGDETACLIYKYNAGSGERNVSLVNGVTACLSSQ